MSFVITFLEMASVVRGEASSARIGLDRGLIYQATILFTIVPPFVQ